MRDSSPKLAAILSTARALFLQHGLRRVSVEEVCQRAAVSKRTFYKYFRNKDALAHALLEQLFTENQARLETVLEAKRPVEEVIHELIAIKTQLAADSSAALYREVMAADSELGRFARQQRQKWDKRVRRYYQEAQRQGKIRQELDIDLLMILLARQRELLQDPELSAIQPDFAKLTETLMTCFFYGILPAADGRSTASKRQRRRR